MVRRVERDAILRCLRAEADHRSPRLAIGGDPQQQVGGTEQRSHGMAVDPQDRLREGEERAVEHERAIDHEQRGGHQSQSLFSPPSAGDDADDIPGGR